MESEELNRIILLLEEIKNKSTKDYSFDIHNGIIEGLDHAINGHRGLMDRTDLDRMEKDRQEANVIREQVNSLFEQTQQIKKQTFYIFVGLFATILASIASTVFAIFN